MKHQENKKVLLTRPSQDAQQHISDLVREGFTPFCIPAFEIESIPKASFKIEQALPDINWVVFTSTNAIKHFPLNLLTAKIQVACVGNKTAEYARSKGVTVDFVPGTFTANELANELPVKPENNVLYPCSKKSSDTLQNILQNRNCHVIRVNSYYNKLRSWSDEQITKAVSADFVVFMSGSAVKCTIQNIKQLAVKTKVISIGPSTSKTCEELNVQVDFTASPHNWKGILETLIKNR